MNFIEHIFTLLALKLQPLIDSQSLFTTEPGPECELIDV